MDRVDLELQDALGEGLPSVGFGSCSAAFLQPRRLAPLTRGRCNHRGPAATTRLHCRFNVEYRSSDNLLFFFFLDL